MCGYHSAYIHHYYYYYLLPVHVLHTNNYIWVVFNTTTHCYCIDLIEQFSTVSRTTEYYILSIYTYICITYYLKQTATANLKIENPAMYKQVILAELVFITIIAKRIIITTTTATTMVTLRATVTLIIPIPPTP